MKKLLISGAVFALVAVSGLAFADDTTSSTTTTAVPSSTATVTTTMTSASDIKAEIIQLIEQVLVLMNQELSNLQSGVATSTAMTSSTSTTGAVSVTCSNLTSITTQSTSTPWAQYAANTNSCSASSTSM